MFSFVSFYSWQCSKVTIDKLLFCKLEGKVRGTKDIITVIGIIGGESGMRCLAFAGCICVVSQLWVVGMILLAWVKYSSCFITVYEVGVIGFGCSLYSFNSIFFLLFSHTKSIPTFFFNDIWRSIQHPIDIIYFSLCLSYHIINIYTYNYMLVFFSLRIEIRFEYPSHISKTRGARGLRAPTK